MGEGSGDGEATEGYTTRQIIFLVHNLSKFSKCAYNRPSSFFLREQSPGDDKNTTDVIDKNV